MLYKVWFQGELFDFSTIIDSKNLDEALTKANELALKYGVRIKVVDCIHSRTFKNDKPYIDRRLNQ